MDFVWNDIQAEDIRRDSQAAMQGSVEDMKQQAELFLREARQLKTIIQDRRQRAAKLSAQAAMLSRQADSIAATLPIMRWETVPGIPPAPSTMERVVDESATSERQSQVDDLRQQAAELHAEAEELTAKADVLQERVDELMQSANKLTQTADALEEKIAEANALFAKISEAKNDIEHYYAGRAQELIDRLEDLIHRIGDLRDSVGNKFTSEADGMVYFGSSSQSVVEDLLDRAETPEDWLSMLVKSLDMGWKEFISNSPVINLDWDRVAELLSKEISDAWNSALYEAHFAGLARIFVELEHLSDIERFLNLMAQPVILDPDVRLDLRPQGILENGIYSICPNKLAGLRHQLDVAIAVAVTLQKGLTTDDHLNQALEAQRQIMMQRTALLYVLQHEVSQFPIQTRDMNIHHMFLGRDDGRGPFRLTDAVINDKYGHPIPVTRINFQEGLIGKMGRTVPTGVIALEATGTRIINLSRLLYDTEASVLMQRMDIQQLLSKYEFDFSSFVSSQLSSTAIDLLKNTLKKSPVFASLLQVGLMANKLQNEMNKAANIQNTLYNQYLISMFGNFHEHFALQGIIIHETGKEWRMLSWPTAYSYFSLSELNRLRVLNNDPSLPWIPPLDPFAEFADLVFTSNPPAIEIIPVIPSTIPLEVQHLYFSWEDFLNNPIKVFDVYRTRSIEEIRDIRVALEQGVAQRQSTPSLGDIPSKSASVVIPVDDTKDTVVEDEDRIVLLGEEATLPGQDTPHAF